MKKIKWLMFDLDGTLLNEAKQVTDKTKQVLETMKSMGIRMGVATGRPLAPVMQRVKEYGIEHLMDVLVCYNGVLVYDKTQDKTYETFPIQKSLVDEIYDHYQKRRFNYCLYDQGVLYTSRIDASIQKVSGLNLLKPLVMPIEEVDKDHFYKLIITVDEGRMDEVDQVYESIKDDRFHGFKTQHDLFEFVDARVSKSYGILKLVSQYGDDLSNVMAFGDTTNDLEMLKDCGWGVCMINGTDDAKNVSDDIALSNEEDGVAQYLETYFGLK